MQPVPKPVALVVDDDAMLRMLVGRSVERAGFALQEAGSLDELEAELGNGAPDLVVLDLTLGRVGPADLLDRLAELRCSAPILPLTGLPGPELELLLNRGRDRGLRLHPPVRKPVRLDDLARILRRYRP